MDEGDWIRRVKQGDQAGWEPLMQAHQEAAFRLAYLLLGDADDAEDVAQEAFLRAYRSLEHFDSSRPLRPWLLSITANLARNRKRSAGRYLAALRRLIAVDPPGNTGHFSRNTEEQSVQNMEAQTLWQAVKRLDETGRQVVYLRFFLGCSVEETAEVLRIPIGTVKSRLHRSLARLRAVLENEFPALLEGHEG